MATVSGDVFWGFDLGYSEEYDEDTMPPLVVEPAAEALQLRPVDRQILICGAADFATGTPGPARV